MKKLYFIVEGTGKARDAVRKILAEELGTEPQQIAVQQNEDSKNPGLVIAAAALVFSVPAAILAAYQLKERLAAGKKLDEILSRVDSLDLKMKDGLSISIRTEEGRTLRLKKSSLPAVVEALSRLK